MFELKKMIALQLGCCSKADGTMELETPPHPYSLKLIRETKKNKAIGDSENGTTLGDFFYQEWRVPRCLHERIQFRVQLPSFE